MGLFSQYIIRRSPTNHGNKHYSPRPCCWRGYLNMFRVTVMIYCDGTLKMLHIPICSGFPDWQDYRALRCDGDKFLTALISTLALSGCFKHTRKTIGNISSRRAWGEIRMIWH